MLLLDDTSPLAVVVDKTIPPSAARLREQIVEAWPRLTGRIQFVQQSLDAVPLLSSDVVVSSHACGRLTDVVLDRAVAAGARAAVLPCCHDLTACETGPIAGWVDGPLAVDIMRAVALERRGYRVWTQTIPDAITSKNRLLIAAPCQTWDPSTEDTEVTEGTETPRLSGKPS